MNMCVLLNKVWKTYGTAEIQGITTSIINNKQLNNEY